MRQYHELLKYVLENGIEKSDRAGVGTLSTFGYQTRFNLNDGFPLVTTKKLHLKSVIYELLWFLNGDSNIKFLNENAVSNPIRIPSIIPLFLYILVMDL